MKHSLLRSLFLSSALLTSAVVFAGPGPQYWQQQRGNANPAPAPRTQTFCPDSKVVTETRTIPAWPNGRGPRTETQVVTKHVCTSCATKGATSHDCATGCNVGAHS